MRAHHILLAHSHQSKWWDPYLHPSPDFVWLPTASPSSPSHPLLHPSRSLTDLDVSSNRLRGCLCGEVGLLPRLRTLNLRGNRLGALPPGLAGCSGLVELFAGEDTRGGVCM